MTANQDKWDTKPGFEQAALDDLRRRFAEFRGTARPRDRIPDELRRAALGMIDDGARPALVAKACGVPTRLIKIWKEREQDPDRKMNRRPAKVFSVVPTSGSEIFNGAENHLELKVGVWSITLRRSG